MDANICPKIIFNSLSSYRKFHGSAGQAALFILLILLFTGYRAKAEVPIAANCPDCNIILISLDTLRADALGTYGYARDTSPNLDLLSRQGTVFLNAYSQAPSTLPSHMSIFTSQYPWTHKVEVILRDRLAPDTVTLPMVLQTQGYRTVWSASLDNPNLSMTSGLERGFDERFSSVPAYPFWSNSALSGEWQPAMRWLEENKNSKFFIFLHSNHIHAPYTRNKASLLRFPVAISSSTTKSPDELEAWLAKNIDTETDRAIFKEIIKNNTEIFTISNPQKKRETLINLVKNTMPDRFRMHRKETMSILERIFASVPGDAAIFRASYDAGVYETDTLIGILNRKLEELGLTPKTMLVITSDHGEEFMEHGELARHLQLYTETLHVPLILVIPGKEAGKRILQMVQSIDIMPTILEAVGAPIPARAEGRSLLSLPQGKGSEKRNPLVFAAWRGSYAARDSRYTYLINNYSEDNSDASCLIEEFYDRKTDPGELKNIFTNHKKRAAKFSAPLFQKIKFSGKGREYAWPDGISEEIKDNILKTGYW